MLNLYIRATNNSSSCIDLLFTNYTTYNVTVVDDGTRDHKGIMDIKTWFKNIIVSQCLKTTKHVYLYNISFSARNVLLFESRIAK